MTHGVTACDTRVGPYGLHDLVDMGRAASLADEILEELPGPLQEPVALDRYLFGLDPSPAEGADAKVGVCHPVRLGATTSVTDSGRSQVHGDLRAVRPH